LTIAWAKESRTTSFRNAINAANLATFTPIAPTKVAICFLSNVILARKKWKAAVHPNVQL
jgi:hypothetical protein